MTVRILAAASPGEIRVAAVRGDTLLDYAIDRPGAPDGVGDLHRARIRARVPAMAGAFVAFGDATLDGFLPDTEGGKGLSEGDAVIVRITRAAQGGKGPRLSTAEAFKTGPLGLLRRGPGVVERLAALHPDAPVAADDPALVAALQPALGARLSAVRTAFDDAVASAVDALADPLVALPGGGTLHIAPTPALVAIDVDTGPASAERRGKAAAQLGFNRAILPALARQIRLRNLSGAILVDLAGLPARRRESLGPDFAAALAEDPLRPRLLGFTALGLAEIVRPRVHPPLHEVLSGSHAAGLAALREAMHRAAARPAEALTLRAPPGIVAALQADPVALPDLARRTGRTMILRSDPAMAAGSWMLEAA